MRVVDGNPADAIQRREALTQLAALGAAALLPIGAAGLLGGCSRGPGRGSVVIYASADDVLARIVFAACTAATGVEIVPVFDTEATKNTGLEARLRSERDRPRADLFWSSEGFSVVRLAAEGLLAELPFEAWSQWPEAHRDPQRRWAAFSARARVVVTNRRQATPRVHDWAQLASPDRRGLVAIADPRFGTTRAHLAALEQSWYAARAQGIEVPTLTGWLMGLRRGGVRVLPGGNAATVEAVAAGECAYGLTDTDDALAAIERGLPLVMTLPRTLPEGVPGGGTMIVPNTIAKIAKVPRSNEQLASADRSPEKPDLPVDVEGRAARVDRVAAWFLSRECEAIIASSASKNLPLGGDATK
ncbi:MAG: extracellular solute-binding protein, partial [Phycisphaerales bacterium]